MTYLIAKHEQYRRGSGGGAEVISGRQLNSPMGVTMFSNNIERIIRALPLALLAAALALPATSQAQDQSAGSAGGSGGTAFSLACPNQMILIGISGKSGLYVDSIRGICSRYNASGQRVGSTSNTSTAGGGGGTAYTLTCPGNRAISSFSGKAATYVDRLSVFCSDVNSAGRATGTAQFLGQVGTSPGGSNFSLACPNNKLGRVITGRAASWVDSIGLTCNYVPVAATQASVSLPNNGVGTSGTAMTGTVSLNGYALQSTTINLASSLANVTVPASVTIAANANSGTFAVSSTAAVAGCSNITGSGLGTASTKVAVLSPPPPSDAGFTFTVANSGLIPAPGRGTGTLSTLRGAAAAPVTLASSNTTIATVPATVTLGIGPTSASFDITTSGVGCSVLTATRNARAIRKTVRTYLLEQGL